MRRSVNAPESIAPPPIPIRLAAEVAIVTSEARIVRDKYQGLVPVMVFPFQLQVECEAGGQTGPATPIELRNFDKRIGISAEISGLQSRRIDV